tara:strand:+ start:201 stop:398 length:198 start_codon:yes stop_codon:yes gene_type:complete
MKLKTIKAHYFEGKYWFVGSVYMADKNHGASAVRNGICEQMDLPKRPKKEKKVDPITKKGKLEKK